MIDINKIYNGNALEVLKTFPDNFIDCVITSPPFWNLRDYNIEGQLGLEKDFNEYIDKLCNIFDEIKRVLKKTGTCWVNMGDTYSTQSGSMGDSRYIQPKYKSAEKVMNFKQQKTKLQDKCLCMIPERFAIEMINRGWILRNQIIWYKLNSMPSSVKDRFSVDYEKFFFLLKNKNYYFKQQFEKRKDTWGGRWGKMPKGNRPNAMIGRKEMTKEEFENYYGDKRNKRCVWNINTKPFKDSHFATFPPELVEIPIDAGCPEFFCKKCGIQNIDKIKNEFFKNEIKCQCGDILDKGIVLDPFCGSGTTLMIAEKFKKNWIGIELNKEYIEIAYKRIMTGK